MSDEKTNANPNAPQGVNSTGLVGIMLPDMCPRHRTDCEPLSQIISEECKSFICCGYGSDESKSVITDRFRFCWKNKYVDIRDDMDERDIKDTISVLAQALSVDANG